MDSMRGGEEQLDALFRAYHQACGSPEASPNFMPNLWARIESRQSVTFSFRRMANAFATAAVALSLALGVYMAIPSSNQSFYSQTYVETLAEANTPDARDFVNPVSLEIERVSR